MRSSRTTLAALAVAGAGAVAYGVVVAIDPSRERPLEPIELGGSTPSQTSTSSVPPSTGVVPPPTVAPSTTATSTTTTAPVTPLPSTVAPTTTMPPAAVIAPAPLVTNVSPAPHPPDDDDDISADDDGAGERGEDDGDDDG